MDIKVNDLQWPITRYVDMPDGRMEEDPHGGWVHVDDVAPLLKAVQTFIAPDLLENILRGQ